MISDDTDNSVIAQLRKEKDDALKLYKDSSDEMNTLRERCINAESSKEEVALFYKANFPFEILSACLFYCTVVHKISLHSVAYPAQLV